jgi:HPt (histidine-containing phosphotransfer) domain-containing protein
MTNVIDRAVLDDLCERTGNDAAFMSELIDTYLEDASGLLGSMQRAIASLDTVELRRAAHTLKSSSASVGARVLAGLCQDLEQRAQSPDLDNAVECAASIRNAFVEVERELRVLYQESQ